MIVLLDTNVLLDLPYLRLDPTHSYGASILSRAELEFGVQAAPGAASSAARRRNLNELDDRFDWIEFDVECSRSYGVLAAHAKGKVPGSRVRSKDALIAAQAHRLGAAVMTSDRDDFRPFEGLVQVVSPPPRAAH